MSGAVTVLLFVVNVAIVLVLVGGWKQVTRGLDQIQGQALWWVVVLMAASTFLEHAAGWLSP